MTQDEIIEMAIEVGCIFPMENEFWGYTCEFSSLGALEDFAQLVAEREREECAKVCDKIGEQMTRGKHCATAIRARGEA